MPGFESSENDREAEHQNGGAHPHNRREVMPTQQQCGERWAETESNRLNTPHRDDDPTLRVRLGTDAGQKRLCKIPREVKE